MTAPVLIVGAGPVGLTMACELARYRVPLRIIDKSASRTDKSKALAVWSRTLELLERAGCAEDFISAGLKVHGSRFMSGHELIAHVTFDGVESPYPFALMLPQSETERLLETQLGSFGVTVERNVELTEFVEEGDKVSCAVRHATGHTEAIEAAWLIGCDGAHSIVRHRLGLQFKGDTIATDFVLADLHISGLTTPSDELAIFWHQDGMIIFFPISPGRFRIIADLGPSGMGPRPEPTLPEVEALVDRRGPDGLTLSDPIWMAAFGINERKVANYRSGRIFLAGDAAHVHSPAGGQGMNTGMQDAFNLAWKLALIVRGIAASDALLDSYSAERSPIATQVLADSGRLTAIAMTRSRLAQQVRNFLAHQILGFAGAQQAMADRLSETSLAYKDSPLSVGSARGLNGPAPGQRIVDGAAFGHGDTPLFALMAAPEEAASDRLARFPTLLEGGVRAPVDENGIWLVRPDGYVAVASRAGDWAAVDEYLSSMKSPPHAGLR